ncbi:MAG: GDSL-type esterase/lipase family protein [Tenuifilaceae bacterium]|jgi:lysophospholipase L1-like esterase|nr:GDSL-type esterase/lipase family protein [Tenuifilaceae bacterium]
MGKNKESGVNLKIFVIAAILAALASSFIVFLVILKPNELLTQTSRMETIESPNFINIDFNKIEFGTAIDQEKKLAKLLTDVPKGVEPLKILHLGDSHVQADVFTGETRRLLATWFKDEHPVRGFTFPYSIIGSNNPDDYEVTFQGKWIRDTNIRNIGMAGIAITTIDPTSEFTLRLKPDVENQKFDRVKIHFEANDSSIFPLTRKEWQTNQRQTHSATYQMAEPSNEVTIGFDWGKSNSGYVRLLGIDLINSKSKVIYNAAGVNGASVSTFLQSESIIRQISDANPHLVIISLGTNDSYNPQFCPISFGENLQNLIQRVRKTLPNIIIILSTPGDHLINRNKPNPSIELAREQIIKVAAELGCGVWDFHSAMGGTGSINSWADNGFSAPDRLHLNRKGYKFKGAMLFDALYKLTGEKSILVKINPTSTDD